MSAARTVVHFTDTAGFGGAEQMMLTTLAGLDTRRWRPLLAHYPNPGAMAFAAEARRRGVETRVVPGATGARGVIELSKLAAVLREERCSVLHAHLVGPLRGTKGLLAARLARVPAVVATQHLYGALTTRLDRARQRFASTLVHRYIAVSRAMAGELGATVRDPERVVVVHNAIDTAHFDGIGPLPESERGEPPVILALARLHERKGLDHLIRAVATLPDVRVMIAGDGPERERLEALAAELGMQQRVCFLGTRTDVQDLLECCTMLALPSHAEGLPVCVIEAMAAGRPVVATDIAGTDEIVVDGETGILVPPGDERALAAAIGSLLADPASRARMGAAGRERVRRLFSAPAMVRQLEGVYDEVLRDRSREWSE